MSMVRVKRHFQVTLPVDLREQLNLAEGDFLEATLRNGEIILKPKTLVDRASGNPREKHPSYTE